MNMLASQNVFYVHDYLQTADVESQQNHRGCLLWLTGLSGSGKTTIAKALQKRLFIQGYRTFVLDGDNIRHGLCKDLGFSPADRTENIRRIGEVGKLFRQAGMITIAAFVSPYAADRQMVRSLFAANTKNTGNTDNLDNPEEKDFFEVYVKADINTCAARDPKGLYEKAKKGEIANFTGISAPYEAPAEAELILDTTQENGSTNAKNSVEACVDQLIDMLQRARVIPS